ncbi:hypothetical protein [Piscirickettsia salmonis]|uniref:hypothetical protein n=1 Tax=Piscirickettsia salmonis TaxID=1238 RepID=UPI000332BD15|nr:hypothetical protein [Piscirickettsia salmonis]APS58079.1 hypothetical protein AVI52_13060 [Piscirickettsia salmonis]ERL61162.1 hypothetical protein K661_02508 [Piscirickettsia salmonis LF-89 = ATCC VR-1361]PEQ15254.1 hypothetical protein X973_13750 [Piscirickettsia salmonis]QGN76378.1 hypothetical protein Psal001_00559 [Piscirickettsia salmonis]QGN79968.1 hypothetical protein Psal002_00584 [Piscirickettsia salmonis]
MKPMKVIRSVKENLIEFVNDKVDLCKLINFRFDYKKMEVVLILKIAASPIPFEMTAVEIASCDHWINQFSRLEVRLITYLACCELNDLMPLMLISHRVDSGKVILTFFDNESKSSLDTDIEDFVKNEMYMSRVKNDQKNVIWYLYGLNKNK